MKRAFGIVLVMLLWCAVLAVECSSGPKTQIERTGR